MDWNRLGIIGRALDLDPDRLVDWWERRLRVAGERERLARRLGRSRLVSGVVDSGAYHSAFERLYPDSALEAAGLQRFFVRPPGGNPRRTTIVGRPKALGAVCRMQSESEQCRLIASGEGVATPAPLPDIEDIFRILDGIAERNVELWEQAVYRLVDFRPRDGRFEADFALDSFLRYRFSVGAMPDEMIEALIATEGNVGRLLDEASARIPLRRRFLPDAESVAAISRRMCAGGIHGTIAIRRPAPDDDYVIPIQQRGGRVSDSPNAIAIVPTGFHQPSVDPLREILLSHTFWREMFEELFGGMEPGGATHHLRHDWYAEVSEPLRWLRANPEAWMLLLTGMGLNLATGNYEIAVLLVIVDTTFWERFSHTMVGSWEASPIEGLSPLITTRPRGEKDGEAFGRFLTDARWYDPSLFSIGRALPILREIDPGRIDLPEIELPL